MNCPKCKSPTEVINSRKKNGTVARRRLCSCGERFSTKEVIVASKQVSLKKEVKEITEDWTVKVDENTPEWAKKMIIKL